MKQCTIHNESVSISSRDILTEILRQGAQEMLAQAINNEVAEYICLNHPRLKARREQRIASGDGCSMSSPPSRSQMVSRTGSDGFCRIWLWRLDYNHYRPHSSLGLHDAGGLCRAVSPDRLPRVPATGA